EDRHARIEVDHHAGEAVPLPVDQAVAVGAAEIDEGGARFDRAADPTGEEVRVDALAWIFGEDPDGDGAEGIVVAARHETAAVGEIHHAAGGNAGRLGEGLAEDPGVAGAEVAAQAAGQLQFAEAHVAFSSARSS